MIRLLSALLVCLTIPVAAAIVVRDKANVYRARRYARRLHLHPAGTICAACGRQRADMARHRGRLTSRGLFVGDHHA